jgi:hypothetical protein
MIQLFSSFLPEKLRRRHKRLKDTYGIGIGEYQDMLEEQDFKCAICETHVDDLNFPLDVDHDHDTHEVRGLLCRKCNLGIGLFKDSIRLLKNAIKYLSNE